METSPPQLKSLLTSVVNEFDPMHDLDRLNRMCDSDFITPELIAAYNQLHTTKHLIRGALLGVLITPSSADFHDTAIVAAICAVIDVVQYALRARGEMKRRGF